MLQNRNSGQWYCGVNCVFEYIWGNSFRGNIVQYCNIEVMLRHRKMNPIVPMPPKSPFCGNNLQGPSSKKLAIPLAAEITEVNNVAKKKVFNKV